MTKHRTLRALRIFTSLVLVAVLVFYTTGCESVPAKGGKIAPDSTEEKVNRLMKDMTLDEKILQMFIVTPEVLNGSTKSEFTEEERMKSAGEETREALQERPVGGLIYFADNLQSREQTKQMIRNSQTYAKEASGIPLFIGVDEEGGTVARCAKKLGTTKFKPMQSYQDMGTSVARSNAKTIAQDISQFGFNLDFAPVADVNTASNSVIGTRAYSNDFSKAAELVPAAVQGFHDGGVLCTLKHFPGHGNTQEDSHKGTAHLYKTLPELRRQEFLPFQAGIRAGADMVMVGHIVVDKVDSRPATLSKKLVTDVLREELGFHGLIITDSMGMGAITEKYSPGEAAVLAVQAGDDLLLGIYNIPEALAGIRTAVESGQIPESRIDSSVRRILTQKVEMGIL